MRTPEELPLDPEIAAELDAIDATLAGEPVDPRYADVAELALLVRADRPRLRPEFAGEFDERVQRRFDRVPGEHDPGTRAGSGRRPPRFRIGLWPAAGGAAAALAAVIAAVVVFDSGSGPRLVTSSAASLPGVAARVPQAAATQALHGAASSAAAPASPHGASGSASSASPGRFSGSFFGGGSRSSASGSAASSPSATSATKSAPTPAPPAVGVPQAASAPGSTSSVQPVPNGRRIVQSAQLSLLVGPSRIDDVAQEAFHVVGVEQGIVRHSTVTATGGTDGYAELQLSVPSGNLADTMRRLSELPYARVASRTDSSQDVNDSYVVDVRRLADARALRTSLLKQLAAATTQQQIDSLNAQIHDAEASIASDEATLNSLNKQVNLSQIDLTISAGSGVGPVPIGSGSTGSGGFTLGKAAHDAGRVLTVAAGVALIGLAALVPVGLVTALVLWIALVLRRRSREQALDAA